MAPNADRPAGAPPAVPSPPVRAADADTDVVVVGGGPVGLLLAGELRRCGAEVTVLEQRAAPREESRATTLHARTMEILASRGLASFLDGAAADTAAGTGAGGEDAFRTLPRLGHGHFGGIRLDLSLPGPYSGQWKLPQPRTEALLRRWALALGARLLAGHTLRRLTDHGDAVTAEADGPAGALRLRAHYLVGCDGEDSTVRRLVGIPFEGTPTRRELLAADVAGLAIRDRRFEVGPHGLAVAAGNGAGPTRVMVHAFDRPVRRRGGVAPDFAEVADVWRRVTGEDITAGTPVWTHAFGDACRQAATYRKGRVLLAGDAAHQQLPVGGQALNLGLHDAVNLGWKLARTVIGPAPDALLDSYHEERHAAGRRTQDSVRTQMLLLLGGPRAEAPRAVLSELIAREPGARRHFARLVSGLDVRYGDDPDAAARDPWVGAAFPHLPLTLADGTGVTGAPLRAGRGTLLLLAGAGAGGRAGGGVGACGWAERAGPWADRVDVVTARPGPAAAPGVAEAAAFLIRPDGHVAWAGDAPSTALADALLRWFGTPAAAPGGTRPASSEEFL
ncbi:FAD-dependent monooxygenase [Streptomyces sp. DSM 44915]|uniref:FAD-dependent monooxygenase n=1 Tax=Streptomyces chisholmiae TaxID=3075540 RepID=A0ABU2JMC6_9ACTN|nr:FAD-dependent monooxygenase [Streptomyces sp. DSM 44915]MDT0266133.1 FAD-dependent monooxygenase [Streptomyces sp. DSM 44915]